MHPLIILLAILAVIIAIRWVKQQPPQKRQRAGFTAALIGAGALLLVAALTGKLNPLVAAVAAAIPMLQRLSNARSSLESLRESFTGKAKGSVFVTDHLHITVDSTSGRWQGKVLKGQSAQRSLDSLTIEQLQGLLTHYEEIDPESAALLNAFVEHTHQQKWQGRTSEAARNETMSVHEAQQILGLEASASAKEIIAAHRRLMQKLHPDRGGSDYLASQINRAKARLLG